MDVSRLGPVYDSEGPFATVVLDVGRGTESGAHEHELRVRGASEELARASAPQALVDQVAERLKERVETASPVARALVANSNGIVFDEVTHQRVDRPTVSWGPLPDLAGWVQLVERNLRFAVALVDHVGGQVTVYNSDVPEPESDVTVGGDDYHVHKVPVGGWSYLRYQHETEQVWQRNADAVVKDVESVVADGVRLVLVAGDPTSAGLVMDGLEKSEADVVRLESGGGRAEDGGDDAHQQAVREALMEYVVSRRLALVHRLKDRLGQGSGAATGVRAVADAFVTGQIDTLLLDPETAAGSDLVIGDHPGLDVGPAPSDRPIRTDQVLLAAAVRTDADVTTLPPAALGGSAIAALLRWDAA
jgi:hypothetical protein